MSLRTNPWNLSTPRQVVSDTLPNSSENQASHCGSSFEGQQKRAPRDAEAPFLNHFLTCYFAFLERENTSFDLSDAIAPNFFD